MKGMPMSDLMMLAALRSISPKTNTRRLIKGVPPDAESIIQHHGRWQAKRKDGEIVGLTLHLAELRCEYHAGERRCLLSNWAVASEWDEHRPLLLPDEAHATFWHVGMGAKPAGLGATRPGRFLPDHMRKLMPQVEITRVEPQRLHDISKEDAIAEGIECNDEHPDHFRDYLWHGDAGSSHWFNNPIESYASLFDHVYKPGAWAKNSWVWSVHFKLVT